MVRNWLQTFRQGLKRTRQGFSERLWSLFKAHQVIHEELFEELEALLLQADVGIRTTTELLESLRERARRERIESPARLTPLLQEELLDRLKADSPGRDSFVTLMVGVNGVGKTTTIAKLAHRYLGAGDKVLLAAADTFRAAAVEQLSVWADRLGVDLVHHQEGADPSAVVYDAIHAARARGSNRVIVDTAGRLHTKTNLMEELKKIKRVIERQVPDEPCEVLLVVDATTGQNAVQQAKTFHEAIGVTGIVLTKLDSTARGGVIIAIASEVGVPVRYVGLGEGLEDLAPFDAEMFIRALFEDGGA